MPRQSSRDSGKGADRRRLSISDNRCRGGVGDGVNADGAAPVGNNGGAGGPPQQRRTWRGGAERLGDALHRGGV